MEREGFVFYRSFYEAIRDMEDGDCAACFRALCEYGLNGEVVAENPIAKAILTIAKPSMDKNNQKYENGKKGGRPKKQEKPNNNQTAPEEKPNDNQTETKTEKAEPTETVTETETVTDTDTETKESVCGKTPERKTSRRSVFTPPTLSEVQEYCRERNNCVDAERFVDYYTSNGWKVGKNQMKDWKAAVRGWEKQDAERAEGQSGVRQQGASAQKKNRFINYPQSEYDYDDIEQRERELREQW